MLQINFYFSGAELTSQRVLPSKKELGPGFRTHKKMRMQIKSGDDLNFAKLIAANEKKVKLLTDVDFNNSRFRGRIDFLVHPDHACVVFDILMFNGIDVKVLDPLNNVLDVINTTPIPAATFKPKAFLVEFDPNGGFSSFGNVSDIPHSNKPPIKKPSSNKPPARNSAQSPGGSNRPSRKPQRPFKRPSNRRPKPQNPPKPPKPFDYSRQDDCFASSGFNFDRYHRWSTINHFITCLAEQHADTMKLHYIGHSYENKKLQVIQLTA